jgi:hypothetical protein
LAVPDGAAGHVVAHSLSFAHVGAHIAPLFIVVATSRAVETSARTSTSGCADATSRAASGRGVAVSAPPPV